MRLSALCMFALALAGCSWRRLPPGPTPEGLVVRVSSRSSAPARREAIEAVLPLFLTEATRREKTADLEAAVFSRMGELTGRERLSRRGDPAVEVRLNRLSGALEAAGLVRPPGYTAGPPRLLLLLSEPDASSSFGVGFAADSLRRALLARGVEAGDARDPLNQRKFEAKTSTEAVAKAGAGGADWFLLGRIDVAAQASTPAGARARLTGDLYMTARPSSPLPISAEATAVAVSSGAASARALESVGEEAAARVAAEVARARAGRQELQVVALGPWDLRRARALVEVLREVQGVQAAAFGLWESSEGALAIRVFVTGFSADELAARLLRREPSLTLASVEPDDGRVSIELPRAADAPGPWE